MGFTGWPNETPTPPRPNRMAPLQLLVAEEDRRGRGSDEMRIQPRPDRKHRSGWYHFSCWWPRKIDGTLCLGGEAVYRRLTMRPGITPRYDWCWWLYTFWEYRLPVPTPDRQDVVTYCKHLDNSYTPPAKCGHVAERGYRTCTEHHPKSPIGTKWFNDYMDKLREDSHGDVPDSSESDP